MGDFVMAIDQGTTGSTVLIIDREGRVEGRAYSEFGQIFPKPGWVEHDPEEIWDVTVKVMTEAIKDARIGAKDIEAIGITNQRETTVLWDKQTGNPVHNAVVWQCRRSADICDRLRKDGHEDLFKKKTGLVIDAYFSGTKIKWLLDNVEGLQDRASSGEIIFGTIDTWLIYKLTRGKVHATDYTNASRTMIYNIDDKKWDKDILDILGIPESMLPQVQNSSGEFGRTDIDQLPEAIPITGVAGDQQAALFGQGCFDPGMIKNTYGTGCFTLIHTGDQSLRSDSGLVTTLACAADGGPAYALEGSIFITGAAVQWLRDEVRLVDSAAQSEELACKVEDTGGVYMVPAFVGLGAPYWDQHARGAILGLTRGSNREHIVRATLESIAYQTRDLLEAMRSDIKGPGFALKELRVDGGACRNDFLMQFQSDILDLPVDRPKMIETTAAGAAFLAGLGTGFWQDSSTIQDVRKTDKVFNPAMGAAKRKELYDGWKAAVSRVRSE